MPSPALWFISLPDAAARYAEQQKSYVAMHQRAMQEEERQREQRLRVVQPAEEETGECHASRVPCLVKRGPHIQADPLRPAGFGDRDQKPPLWGPDGADFLPSDVMFARWNIRATPPNFKTVYQPPPPGAPITPSWYLMKKMEEKGLFYGYNVNLLGSAEVSLDGMPEPPRNGALRTDQPPPEQGPNLSVPPPAFSLALSGPTPADSFLGAGQPRPGVLFASADPAFAGRPPTVVLGVPPADFSVPPPLIPASQ